METPKPKRTPFREALRRAVYQGRNYQHRGMTIHQIMDDITAQIAADHPIEDAAPQLLEAHLSAVENITKALELGDRGDWANAEIFLNNQRGISEVAIAKATKK